MKKYKVPYALPIHEWDIFWADIKKRYPVQHFFRRTIPHYFRVHVQMRLHDVKWKVLHRVHPKHRYHVIKPRTLAPGYHDPVDQIRAAAFDTMARYAERKLMGNGIDGTKWQPDDLVSDHDPHWESSVREQIEYERKVIELRNWWVIDRKNREKVEEAMYHDYGNPEWGWGWTFDPKHKDTPEYKAQMASYARIREIETEWAAEDQRKFHELVDLLPQMWY